jgi:hypothetical protein
MHHTLLHPSTGRAAALRVALGVCLCSALTGCDLGTAGHLISVEKRCDGRPCPPDATASDARTLDGAAGLDRTPEDSPVLAEAGLDATAIEVGLDAAAVDTAPPDIQAVDHLPADSARADATPDAPVADHAGTDAAPDAAVADGAGTVDSAVADASGPDIAPPADAALTDTTQADLVAADGGDVDVASADSAVPDAALADSQLLDAAVADTSAADHAVADAGLCGTVACTSEAQCVQDVCVCAGGSLERRQDPLCPPWPATTFALQDRNAASPTYHEDRDLAAERGKVIVFYYVSFT